MTRGTSRCFASVILVVLGILCVGYIRLNEISIHPIFDESSNHELRQTCVTGLDEEMRPFQPDVEDDFPTIEGGEARIPHIVHQTYKTESIPDLYWDNIKSVLHHNPNWAYYFWSDDSARRLIAERHPGLLDTYDGYDEGIKRGDALRYVILYEFGGVYLDMDYEVLRPLNRATIKYASLIAPANTEHSVFLYNTEWTLMNCVMFSRPKHPFFKHLIEQLPRAAKETKVLVKATGPFFVTDEFKRFYNISQGDVGRLKTDCSSNSPYFYKGELKEDDDNAVYVPHTQYFNDILDFGNGYEKKFNVICNQTSLPILKQRACVEMNRRGMFRKDTRFTFTKHKWSHIYMRDASKYKYKNITEIIDNIVFY